jgi:RND family efflux transporter MFP subunit
MRTLRRFLPILLAVLVVGALGEGYRRVSSRPPLIETVEARTQDVVRVLAVTGRIRPRFTNRVQPLTSGTVLTLTHKEGDAVRRGAVLATLDAATTQAVIEQATARLKAAQLDAEQRAIQHRRLVTLLSAGAVSPNDVETSQFSLDAARESVRQLEAVVNEQRLRRQDYVLRSPIDGYVVARPVDPGQNVTPQTVLYELATVSGAEIEVDIDEQYLGELRVGLAATVSPLTGDRRQFPATVHAIGLRVSETSGAVPVRLRFDGDAPRVPAGLSVDVNLVIATHPGAVTVSRAAVAGLGDAPYVMLIRNDTVVQQPVDVIDWPSPHIVVRHGIAPGDHVALSPKLVRAGMVVRSKPGPDAI